jgi:hypothetical protein
MKRSFVRRIEKLELIVRSRFRSVAVFRYGHIRYLPPDTIGERHIALVKSEPTALANVQHCEFEERVGPAPEPHHDLSVTVYLTAEGLGN